MCFLVTEQSTNTPMRKLIWKMPDVAAEVFNKCMRGNDKDRDHPKYRVRVETLVVVVCINGANWLTTS